MQLIQSLIILFLKPLSSFNRINDKLRNALVTICSFGLVCYFIAYFTPSFGIRFKLTYDHLIASAVLFILIIFSIEGKLHKVVWNRAVFYSTFLSGLGILIISFLHPIGSGYRAFALMLMIGFPCLYYVWNVRKDYNTLYKRLAAATAIVGIFYYAYCIFISTQGKLLVTSGRIRGTFYDSNMFSMIGMIMVCSGLYMLLVNRDSVPWYILSAVSIGAGISIMKMGVSRLAILVALGSMIAFSIYYLKTQSAFTEGTRTMVKYLRALLLLIAVIAFVMISNLMVEVNNKAVLEQQIAAAETTQTEQTDNEEGVAQAAEKSSPMTSAPQEQVDVTDRFSTEGMDLDSYTAGRYHIWKGYAQFLNLLGNDFSKADWSVLTQNTVKHAHNNFLEIAFRCGVPVACIHTLLELIAGIICLIWLFSPKYKDPAYLFCIVFMICYTVQSLFDIATLPFERPAPLYFYMAMIPMFTFGTDKTDVSGGKHFA